MPGKGKLATGYLALEDQAGFLHLQVDGLLQTAGHNILRDRAMVGMTRRQQSSRQQKKSRPKRLTLSTSNIDSSIRLHPLKKLLHDLNPEFMSLETAGISTSSFTSNSAT